MTATAELPLVSVVVETVTARYDVRGAESMADDLAPTLTGLERQTYPRGRIEAIVVLDPEVPPAAADDVRARWPFVRLAEAPVTNYYAAKNAGARAARGAVVALLDGDCAPDPEWLEHLVPRLEPGVAAVAGRTRYARATPTARSLSVPDFGNVVADDSGAATGFNINNVAFRREVLLQHPFDARVRRNGGCYFLFHELRAAGERVVYEPGAVAAHGVDDIRGLEFVRKHFGRGFDGVAVYRLDDDFRLRGTRIFRRFGIAGLVAITANRVLQDWTRIGRHRRQIGIAAATIPYFALVTCAMRTVELAGGIAAVVKPGLYD